MKRIAQLGRTRFEWSRDEVTIFIGCLSVCEDCKEAKNAARSIVPRSFIQGMQMKRIRYNVDKLNGGNYSR